MTTPPIYKSVQARLGPAKAAEVYVAHQLTELGFHCSIGPLERHSQNYTDQVDIMAYLTELRRGYKVEVKGISKVFTCAEDFPSKDPLVCSESIFARRWPTATHIPEYVHYALCSVPTGAIVMVPGGSLVERNFRWYDHFRKEAYGVVRTKKENLRDLKAWKEALQAKGGR